jgi:hypothetical protein
MVRLGLSAVYDVFASVCITGYIWAFHESWPVTADQFALTWMTLWLLFHIHYLYLDVCTAFFRWRPTPSFCSPGSSSTSSAPSALS